MPQINDIRELAQQNARYVSNSPQDWMSYLDVAARLYRYSFTDALLIHAQRPDATACAELELWNQKMSRWVNRGAKGIALLDDTGPRTKLRYVFDIADTHLVRGGKTPLLWNLDSHEHEQAILDHLADTYGLSQTDSMNTALMELAQQLTADNLDEAMDGLAYEVKDTFLEELDEDNIRVRFRELMTNSIFYTLSRRCGQEPMDVLDDDDFIRIVDFNKLPVLSFLGNAVSEQCEAVLFDIGREMRKIYKKEITQQLEKSVDSLYNTNTDFSALKRETEETTTKGGQENGVDVLPQGRLSVPESGRAGRAADHREVRDAAQDVPERESQELVSEYADERQTESALGADRGSSGEPGGDPAGQPEREVSGTEQGEGPAGMGGTPEQPDGDGRRNRLEGIGVQLTETTTEQDLSEAEEEIASAFSFPDLPTVEQQIRAIEEPIRARYADEIALDSEVVDEILRTGSNRSKGQLRLIYNFMVEKTPEEYTEFVKNEYGTGGKGFEIDGAKYAVWFDDLGLRIAAGDTAKGGTIANASLSWEDVSNRIHELLRQGEYAPQAVLDAARQNALQEHAQTLAYMERDLADGVAEVVFQDTAIFRGGFPEMTDRLAGLLDDTDFLTDLNERLSALGEGYVEDKDLMRMHFYKPDKVAALFQQFAKPYQNFAARDGFHWNEYKKFITEDEINAYFTRGSNYSDSRLAIYSFFLNHEDKKERADFLKDHYGIGGSSHALCGADDSHEDHDGRGIALERGAYGNPDASVHLNWNQAAGRIDRLIRDSEYLKPADYSRMPAYEREQMAMRVMGFYHHLPNDVERPYPQDLYHEEGRKALVEKLADTEQSAELLEQMDNALLSVPLDSGKYERKAESLSILHQYVEGTYTIFPEKKRAVEIAVPEQGQMSMFDFMEQEPQSKEQSTAAAVEEPRKDVPIADEKPSEQTLQPMPLDAANEYNALKERYPDALVGYEQYGNFEFYGEDAKRVSELLGSKLLEKETALGKVEVSGFPREQWASQAMKLWKQGESVYLSGQQEDGTHAQTKYFRREEYLPVNTAIELDDREFRVDSVDFGNGTVSLQDMTLAKEARYPIFRTEQLEYIRHLYEQADVPMEEAVEITVFTALHNAGVAYEDFSPEQMDVIYSVAEAGGELEELLNPDFPPEQMQLIADVQNRTDAISRAAAEEALEPLTQQPMTPAEVNHARRQHNLPLDSGAETEQPAQPKQKPINFRITDDDLGAGGPKTKYKANVEAIRVLQTLDAEQRQATAEEQEILSRYVGWGGIPQAFDENNAEWSKEYAELQSLLTVDEYKEARASTLNAFYTSPTVIKAMYEALGNMGLSKGNVLEPSCGVGNFMGLVPDSMEKIRMYGVELDSISGRIAQQLYQKNKIAVQGFETMQFPDSFFDCVVGNVPFGNYKVPDKRYDRHNFLIHDYFIAKSLDLVRPGGVVAVVTSSGTMDKKDSSVREYLANRADLVGAIRLPNNAFRANAGTDVVSDIIFLQKRDRPIDHEPDWVQLGKTEDGFAINQYFVDHPEMVLGEMTTESTQYGREELTVAPIEGAVLADQLAEAVQHIEGQYVEVEVETPDVADAEVERKTLPADPDVKNFSYAVVDGEVYYRENSIMTQVELSDNAKARVTGMVELRQIVNQLIQEQLDDYPDEDIKTTQAKLNTAYDAFTAKYGLLNDRKNGRLFEDDSSYYLLCSLENLDENKQLKSKADMFTKRTIRPEHTVTSVDTPSEALAVSIGEHGRVDLPYMAELLGSPGDYERITTELQGVIFKDPSADADEPEAGWQTADEYLSGNVRNKLRMAQLAAESHPEFKINVEALTKAQPKDLEASEIDIRLGATWLNPAIVQQFMMETFQPPYRIRYNNLIQVRYSPFTSEWRIGNKSAAGMYDIMSTETYGTHRATAYKILEDTLNLRDCRIYDTIEEDGKERRVLNQKETMLAQQKQQAIKDTFAGWVWQDPQRRNLLVKQYNELFNSTRPREYDGSHIHFVGMNPEINLREHQRNAVAHVLYGGNTLLAHEVGAGKSFEMAASAMESKRLGLCQKSLFVVPNHLTEQWASEFLRLYPNAKLLVTSKKDFEPANRKRFCARIATGDYDAVIIGHSQFEKIPLSAERQARIIEDQIEEIEKAIAEAKEQSGEHFTVKQMEKTRKTLEVKLKKLQSTDRKDDVVTFEQLGVDRLFVDESQNYKNLYLYTKMRNVAGLSTSEAQKSSDMFGKCRYLDEVTGGRGVIFATGTPISNSMTEMYTLMRYLQYSTLQQKQLTHFDAWASTFGETTTAIELAPEGTGYRARTRFAKFFNLPELMNMFKEAADIKTSDQLHLPVPEAKFETVVVKPSEIQQDMVKSLSERAAEVHSGAVDPSVDNMLKITSDGRKIGLDQRLMNPLTPDDPDSKLNACVDNVLRIWNETKEDNLTQLIFCDMSTPKGDGSFNVYDDIRTKLLAAGVPESEVEFIHNADTEGKKADLFSKVRSGKVRVLLGSTAKMGAGTNVQTLLVAVHHLDVGWRPSDMTQRNGRIIRQGNKNKQVYVYNYVTEGTFDAYLWQTLENKQKFISQIMTSKSPMRSCDDVDEQALSYAEVKALCAGDPRIREKMDLDVQVAKLKVLRSDYQNQKYRLEDKLLKHYPEEIQKAKNRIAALKNDAQIADAHPQDKENFCGMTIKGMVFDEKKAAGERLMLACKEMPNADMMLLGTYRGFELNIRFDSFKNEHQIVLRGELSYPVPLGDDPRGNIVRLDNAIGNFADRIADADAALDSLEQQKQAAEVEIAKPFAQEEELQTKSARLAELDALLNMEHQSSRTEPEAEEKPDARPSVLAALEEKADKVEPVRPFKSYLDKDGDAR